MVELNNIKSVSEAQDALYNGKKLTQDFEKNIFNSTLLSPNGTLDSSLLQSAALLLEKVKKAEEMSTGDDAAKLTLNDLKRESNSRSISYQVVNSGNSQVDREITHLTTLLGQSPDRYKTKTKQEWESELKTKDLLLKQLEKELADEKKIVDSYAETTGRLMKDADIAKKKVKDVESAVDSVKGNTTLNALLTRSKQKNEKVWTYGANPGNGGFYEMTTSYGDPKFVTWGRCFDTFSYYMGSFLKSINKGDLFGKIENTSNGYFDYLQGTTNKSKLDDVKAAYDRIMNVFNNYEVDFVSSEKFFHFNTGKRTAGDFSGKQDWEIADNPKYVPGEWNVSLGDLFLVMESIFPDGRGSATSKKLDDNPLLDASSSFCLDKSLLDKTIEINYFASTDGSSLTSVWDSSTLVKRIVPVKKNGARNDGLFRLFWDAFPPSIQTEITVSKQNDSDGDGKPRIKIKREWDNKIMREGLANKDINIRDYIVGVKDYLASGSITNAKGEAVRIDWTPEWAKVAYDVAKIASRKATGNTTKADIEKAVKKVKDKKIDSLVVKRGLMGISPRAHISQFMEESAFAELSLYDEFKSDSEVDWLRKRAMYEASIERLKDLAGKSVDLEGRRDQAKLEKKLAEIAVAHFSGKTPDQLITRFKEIYGSGTNKGTDQPKYELGQLGEMEIIKDALIAQSTDGIIDKEVQKGWDDIQTYVYDKVADYSRIVNDFNANPGSLQDKIVARGWGDKDEGLIKAELDKLKIALNTISRIRHLGPLEKTLSTEIDGYKKPTTPQTPPTSDLNKDKLNAIFGTSLDANTIKESEWKNSIKVGTYNQEQKIKDLVKTYNPNSPDKDVSEVGKFQEHLKHWGGDKIDGADYWEKFIKKGPEFIIAAIRYYEWENGKGDWLNKAKDATITNEMTTANDKERAKNDYQLEVKEDWDTSNAAHIAQFLYRKAIGKSGKDLIKRSEAIKTTPPSPQENSGDNTEKDQKWFRANNWQVYAVFIGVPLAIAGICAIIWWDNIMVWWKGESDENVDTDTSSE